MAPVRARTSPFIVIVPILKRSVKQPLSRGRLQESLKAIVILPITAKVRPRYVHTVGFSRRTSGEMSRTKMGVVCTRTTLLVTLVNANEEIQVPKWAPRKTPAVIV
jgi:hypothetical protein